MLITGDQSPFVGQKWREISLTGFFWGKGWSLTCCSLAGLSWEELPLFKLCLKEREDGAGQLAEENEVRWQHCVLWTMKLFCLLPVSVCLEPIFPMLWIWGWHWMVSPSRGLTRLYNQISKSKPPQGLFFCERQRVLLLLGIFHRKNFSKTLFYNLILHNAFLLLLIPLVRLASKDSCSRYW